MQTVLSELSESLRSEFSPVYTSEITVVEPVGALNAANAALFQRQLATLLASDCSSVLVDLSQVETLDSAGLMVLISAQTSAHQRQKRFGICGVSPSIRIIFEVTQLDRAFTLFESRADYERSLAT
ncbi:MAG: STAS domain-containing protein [Cyanobacteriota bacterium]